MTDLERRLQALSSAAFPPAPDVRAAVERRIEAGPGPGALAQPGPKVSTRYAGRGPGRLAARVLGAPPRGRRRVLALVLAFVLVPGAAIAAVPGARHAVLDWLGLAHVRVERVPQTPRLPALNRSHLGERVASVEAAARQAGFAVEIPRTLGAPDAVYVSSDGVVSLAYPPRTGLPRESQTGLGLLVTELRARGLPAYFAKTAGPRTLVEPVRVDGAPGAFLSGEPHGVLIEQEDRRVRDLPSRLAGNTLVFERGGLVIRLEARFERRAALALARSVRRAAG